MSALLQSLQTYWPVYLLLLGYASLLAYHAWAGNRETHGVADYYVGGRAMGGVALGLSFFATYSSTNSFVGFAGQSYEWGIAWLLLAPLTVVMSIVAWLVVAPRLRRFTAEMGSLTVADFIGFRFASVPARVAAAVITIFASFFYMTAVFKGIGTLVEMFLEIPYEAAIVLVFVVVVGYTVAGGFISVVKTDAVQGIVMIFAAILLFAGTVRAAGGLQSLADVRANADTAHLFDWNGTFPLVYVLGFLVAGTAKLVTEPRQLSRFYALDGEDSVRAGAYTSTFAFALVYSLLVPLGLYARNIFPEGVSDTDQIVPMLLTQGSVFTPGVAAFLIVAMVAAAMSSLDSVLLVMASTAERDIVAVLRGGRSEAEELRRTRFWVALFAFITALIAMRPSGGIVGLTVLSGSMYAACFAPAVLLGLFWRGGNGAAVLGSFGTGLLVLLVWPLLPIAALVHQVFPAIVLALLVYLVVARAGGPVGSTRLDRLFADQAQARAQSS